MRGSKNDVANMPELTDVQKAWWAGFLDGEGHFAAAQSAQHTNGRRYYIPIIQVSQAGIKGKALVEQLQKDLGGVGTLKEHPTKGRAQASSTLMLYGPVAVHLSRELLPFLRLKQEQAQILSEWPHRKRGGAGYRRGSFIDPEGEAKQVDIFNRLRIMNRRGLQKAEA